jgi:hypothetical protein
MKSEEAINMMNKVQTETVNEFGQIMLQVASTANTLMKRRIVEKGLNASNAKFPDYTTKYKKYKTDTGHYRGFVDFTFSGKMMSNIQVISSEGEHKKGRARIGTMSDSENDKLSGNTDKKGTILDLNEQEITELSKMMEESLVEVWHKNGL